MRIGLVGTDSSHAEQFLQFLNRDNRHAGSRVVALSAGTSERMISLARFYDVPMIFSAPEDLLGKVDAVIVGARHGSIHRAHAQPFLKPGLAVFVDKPLCLNVDDAVAMCDQAEKTGALLTSASALRWQPEMARFRALGAGATGKRALEVTGTFYPQSEYGGAFFYGIHSAEIALELAGPHFRGVRVSRADKRTIEVNFDCDTATVRLLLVTPDPGAESWFGVTMSRDGGQASQQITLPDDYMAPVLDRFMTMATTGKMPLTREELVAPIALLAEIEAQLRTI